MAERMVLPVLGDAPQAKPLPKPAGGPSMPATGDTAPTAPIGAGTVGAVALLSLAARLSRKRRSL